MKKAVGEERYSPAVVLRKYSIYLVSIGTPVSNSMTELYTMMRYLQTELLRDCGINHFDEWAADFGEVKTDYDYNLLCSIKKQIMTLGL